MGKALNVLSIIAGIILLWIMLSWVNILFHNNPTTGDFIYPSWNFFTLLTK